MIRWKPEHGKVLVCVHWNDADVSSPTDAFYEDEISHSNTLVQTYGLLIKKDDHAVIVVTETYLENDDRRVYRGKTTIPSPLVKHIEVIAEPWTPKPRKPRQAKIKPEEIPTA